MKINKIILSFLFLSTILFSCTKNEKFSGSPIGSLEVISLEGTVSTTAVAALTDQDIDFTATLPNNKVFADTVTIEASSIAKSGGRTKAYVDIMPGQSSATGKIKAVGGSIFSSSFDLTLTAINLQTVESGKHYLLGSNNVNIKTGNSTIPDVDPSRLIIKFAWLFPSTTNKLRLNIDRPGTIADANVFTLNSYGKIHYIKNVGTTNNDNISTAEGDYVVNIAADGIGSLINQPQDMPYRLILVHPDGKVQVFEGTYTGLTETSPLKAVLKINKTTTAGVVVYTATDIL